MNFLGYSPTTQGLTLVLCLVRSSPCGPIFSESEIDDRGRESGIRPGRRPPSSLIRSTVGDGTEGSFSATYGPGRLLFSFRFHPAPPAPSATVCRPACCPCVTVGIAPGTSTGLLPGWTRDLRMAGRPGTWRSIRRADRPDRTPHSPGRNPGVFPHGRPLTVPQPPVRGVAVR